MMPATEEELLDQAWSIAGLSLAELADKLNMEVPDNLRSHKGWVGELIEIALGATAGSLPEPDFQHLGIELKTIPINEKGNVSESTHVCNINLNELAGTTWENSLLYKKLQCVLWIPIESHAPKELPDRIIGSPFLWHADKKSLAQIRLDWEELIEMLTTGEQEHVSAHMGQILQVRPKAANSHALTESSNESGKSIKSLPRGFYLRSEFTRQLINNFYHQ